jgi:hypothetical protein
MKKPVKKVSPLTLRALNENTAFTKEQKLNRTDPQIDTLIPRVKRRRAIDKAKTESDSLIKKYGGDAAKSRGFMAYEKSGDPAAKTTNQKVYDGGRKAAAKPKPKPAMTPNRASVAKKK